MLVLVLPWIGALARRLDFDETDQSLGFAQTIPIVSFARLGGACATCRARIDPTHLVGELVGAGLLVLALWIGDPLRGLLVAVLGFVLLASAVIDARTQRLPDALTLLILALTLGLTWLHSPSALGIGLMTGAVTFAILFGVRALSRRKDGAPGLGLGDVKLFSVLAIWLGLATPWALLAASLLGLAIMRVLRPHDGRLAFGPMIAASAWIIGLLGEGGLWPTMA